MEEITNYYFALYAKAGLQIFTKKLQKESTRFDNMTFYDKQYYCAHVYPSTHKTIDDCEELFFFAKDDEDDENDYKSRRITLKEGEWVEDIHDCKLVCIHPHTNKEVDAYEFLEKKGYTCDWSESGSTKFASWVDEDDLP